MSKKQKKFADDGWAVWIDGDDTSTVYINDWLNPKGKSYVVQRMRKGVKDARLQYKVLQSVATVNGTYSLVWVRLVTGRFHQIRVQFASRRCK